MGFRTSQNRFKKFLKSKKLELFLKFNGTHIASSPYTFYVSPTFDAFKVTSTIESVKDVRVGQFKSFEVDCHSAGEADIEVGVYDSHDQNCVQSIQQEGALYTITFAIENAGDAQIIVKYGGDMCPAFPKNIFVLPTSSE